MLLWKAFLEYLNLNYNHDRIKVKLKGLSPVQYSVLKNRLIKLSKLLGSDHSQGLFFESIQSLVSAELVHGVFSIIMRFKSVVTREDFFVIITDV